MISILKGLIPKKDILKSDFNSGVNYKIVIILLSILSGSIYIFIFKTVGYDHIDLSLYTNRDDGLISFSHGVNWHDYGFIGVSPSGERVEGYSTPVHFFLYYIFYSLFSVGFDPYIKWQTIIGTFLLGYIFFNFFKEKPVIGILFSIISAILLSFATRFLEWHGSGMENPLSEVFLLLSVYLLYQSVKDNNISYYYSLVFATASLTRIENIYYIFPLLFIFLVMSWNCAYRKKAVITILFTILILVIIHGLRIWYFGSFQPNTSIGQNLDLKKQIFKTITVDTDYYSYCSLIGLKLVTYNNGLLILIAFFLFYYTKRTPSNLFFLLTVFSILILTFFHAFIFKGERLDPIRYGGHLAPIATTALLFPFANFSKLYNRHLIYLIPAVIVICIFLKGITRIQAENICCPVTAFEFGRNNFLKIKEDNKLVRPMLANPDLGIISYNKDFNMMDMAYIGSPILAKLSKSNVLFNEYLFEVNTPDILELHEYWACLHTPVFADPRFKEKFNAYNEWNSPCPPTARAGIFLRADIVINSGSKERVFYEKIKNAIHSNQGSLISILNNEIKNNSDTSIYSSLYIVRVLYQFLPELRKDKLLEEVLVECKKLPAHEYAIAYLSSYRNSHWSDQVISSLMKYYIYNKFNKFLLKPYASDINKLPDSKFLKSEKDYKVYLNRNTLLYYSSTGKKNLNNPFFVHVVPENIEDIPTEQRGNGFQNLDFDSNSGIVIENQHYIPIQLPSYKIKRIETGQHDFKDAVWNTVINVVNTN